LQISGTAESLFGKPLAKAPVSLISFQPKSFTSTVADENGKFLFDNLDFNDSIKFVLQAVNARGKNKTKLIYNADKPLFTSPLPVHIDNINTIVPASYLDNNEKQQEELNKLGLGKGRMLKEVKIKGLKIDDKYETQSFAGAGNADQVMHADEISRIQGTLITSLDGRLRGVTFIIGKGQDKLPYLRINLMSKIGSNKPHPMVVIIDGAEVPPESINYLTPNEIETIEVLKYSSAAAYGMQGGNGVLVITTKRRVGNDVKDITSIGILPINVRGYYKAREFYSPKYESTITNTRPDLRSTIYWNPELQTDKDGNASFKYYNANGTGTYKIIVEGIDDKGKLGRLVYEYKVE
jgi:TonB-dependent SusC/RagA subfamily outer membrane receptor